MPVYGYEKDGTFVIYDEDNLESEYIACGNALELAECR